ncbi:hypothetical protein D3C73_1362390 [compost metagenome]
MIAPSSPREVLAEKVENNQPTPTAPVITPAAPIVQPAAPIVQPTAPIPTPPIAEEVDDEITLKLKKLKALFDRQLITQEEYEQKKKEVLSSL